MTYKLMYMETVVVLYNKLNSEGKIPEGLKVKLSLDDNNTYLFKGGLTSNKPYDRFPLYNEDGSLYYNPRCENIYVEMTYQTYNLHKLVDDIDYELALAIYEQYFNESLLSEEGCFVYLLGLAIQDYEVEHYPVAAPSMVDFIDHLLIERKSSWRELQTFLGVELYFSIDYFKAVLHSDNIRVHTLVSLSHFFRLPVQAFIVGGYGK